MYENLRTQIITRLITFLDPKTTKEVMKVFDRIFVDYDVVKKETAVIVRDNSLEECIKVYLLCKKAEGLADGSLVNIGSCLRKFASKMGKPVDKVTPNDVRGYILRYQMTTNIKSASLEKIRQRLNNFFAWCVNEELINRNPCSKIPRIIYKPARRNALTEEQLEYCRMACQNRRDRALLEVFYSTGARISEISRLNITDVNWYDGSITVLGKGSSYYTVYLNAKARVALKEYLSRREDNCPALFVTARTHVRLSNQGMRELIEGIGERAGLPTVLCPHVLRHTMATTAFRNGASLEMVQHMLNHKKPDTTQIYAEMDQARVADEHRRTVI